MSDHSIIAHPNQGCRVCGKPGRVMSRGRVSPFCSVECRKTFDQKKSGLYEKRQRLKEIIGTLGEHATASKIREEAYRVGFGQVSAAMLTCVRDTLWPDRTKRKGGRPKGVLNALIIAVDDPRQCPNCSSRSTKVVSYVRHVNGVRRRRRKCKVCGHGFFYDITQAVAESIGANQNVDVRRLVAAMATEKECTKCKRLLPIDNFPKRASDQTLWRPVCKTCSNDQRAKYGLREALASHEISEETYDAMLSSQGNTCGICQREDFGKRRCRFSIDHDHQTGRVRGLLCDKCNLGIGNFNENIEFLLAAVAYLRRKEVT